jgi:hypothetical protein
MISHCFTSYICAYYDCIDSIACSLTLLQLPLQSSTSNNLLLQGSNAIVSAAIATMNNCYDLLLLLGPKACAYIAGDTSICSAASSDVSA